MEIWFLLISPTPHVQSNIKVLSKLILGEDAHSSLEFNTEVGSLLGNDITIEAPTTFPEIPTYMRTEVALDCFGACNIPCKQKIVNI